MKRVARWEARDGTLFMHKIQCVAHEQMLTRRDSVQGKLLRRTLSFLVSAYGADDKKKTPQGSWVEAGMIHTILDIRMVPDTKKGERSIDCLAAAIPRIVAAVAKLRSATGLDWRIDDDMRWWNDACEDRYFDLRVVDALQTADVLA